jgi:hypothetical protein
LLLTFSHQLDNSEAEEAPQHHRDTLDPELVDVLDHYLEFEGAIFELLNSRDSDHLWDIASPQDSSDTHWASTISKHRSTSYLLPINNMSENVNPNDQARVVSPTIPFGDDSKPRTPRRRMTPIYDDLQTAVNMIRSGTPKSRSSSAGQAQGVANEASAMPNPPVTPGTDRAYSLADVTRKLSANSTEAQVAAPYGGTALKSPATTQLSTEEKRASIPVFPLHPRDSDEDNERAINQFSSIQIQDDDNPAGVELQADDIPLRSIAMSKVRSRTRGEPVSSQEIHASKADIGYIESDSSQSVRASATTDTSTVGNIVDQYAGETIDQAAHDPDVAGTSEPGPAIVDDEVEPLRVYHARTRTALDAGPPPSWPLPPFPLDVPTLKSKRRNSSGMLSLPGEYGHTSQLLQTSSRNTKAADTTPESFSPANPSSTNDGNLKFSKSSNDIVQGVGANFGSSPPIEDDVDFNRSRLSHVSEESSVPSEGAGWAPAVGYAGKPVNTDTIDRAGEVRQRRNWARSHRRTDNIDTSVFPGGMAQHPRIEVRPGVHFPSMGQILTGDEDEDTLTSADGEDWETIYSRSRSNVQLNAGEKERLSYVDSGNIPSMESLSFSKDPVSTWDPLSNKTKRFGDAEDELKEMLKAHKVSTEGLNSYDVAASANAANAPMPQLVPEGSDNVFEHAQPAQPLPAHVQPGFQQSPNSKAQAARSRHPAPLEARHKNPFLEERPAIKPLRQSNSSSTASMYSRRNNNIETASSASSGRVRIPATFSREEILREIDLYDPGKSYNVLHKLRAQLIHITRPPPSPPQLPKCATHRRP